MPVKKQDIQRLVAYGLPYVFIEKVKLSNGFTNSDDHNRVEPALNLVKNQFGTNRVKLDDNNLNNKEYFSNDRVYTVELELFLNEFYIKKVWFGKRATSDMVVKIIQRTHPDVTKKILERNIMDISFLD